MLPIEVVRVRTHRRIVRGRPIVVRPVGQFEIQALSGLG